MAIKVFEDGGFAVTGKRDTELFGLMAMEKKLTMEVEKGFKWGGVSTAEVLRRRFGWTDRSKKKILEKLREEIARRKEERKDNGN